MEHSDVSDDIQRAMRKFPEALRAELAAIQVGAKNGGIISPRRNSGLLVEFERVKKKYDAKIATLRGHGPSRTIDEVERAIAKVAAEAVASISTDNS